MAATRIAKGAIRHDGLIFRKKGARRSERPLSVGQKESGPGLGTMDRFRNAATKRRTPGGALLTSSLRFEGC